MSAQPISTTTEWTFELVESYDKVIAAVASDYALDTYPVQLEIISAEQMMDAYASAGMPVGYHHWSFGKAFLGTENRYRRGQMGLAYEVVINSNPCIAYLMEENTMTMQALVIAHAAYGHNSFFKGNYLFKTWTSADSIIDYLLFAKSYVRDCEQRHGETAVELLLDSCHALMNYGVDSYKRPTPLSAEEEAKRQTERAEHIQQHLNDLWRTIPESSDASSEPPVQRFPAEAEENLLYFIEKHAPLLEPWQREIVRIVRKLGQYFYPQRLTKVMNEGWACFWHYTLLNTLYDRGFLTDGFMMEFLQSHTNVIFQPGFDHPAYSGLNPYTLGFAMMTDIRRIAQTPTREDREWFPELADSDWRESLEFAMQSFKDESFISQYLSPRLIRELKLFSVLDDDRKKELEIAAIHDEHGYRQIRHELASQYDIRCQQPDIYVHDVAVRTDRTLTLRHVRQNRRPLHESSEEVLKHVARLWGLGVHLEELDEQGRVVATQECKID